MNTVKVTKKELVETRQIINKIINEMKASAARAHVRAGADAMAGGGIDDEERAAIVNLKKNLTILAQKGNINTGAIGRKIEILLAEIEAHIQKMSAKASAGQKGPPQPPKTTE